MGAHHKSSLENSLLVYTDERIVYGQGLLCSASMEEQSGTVLSYMNAGCLMVSHRMINPSSLQMYAVLPDYSDA
jgi:hypothetical protein